MEDRKNEFIVLIIVGIFLAVLFAECWGDVTVQPSEPEKIFTLEDLEKMALEKNPTIAQAEALVNAAAGRKIQAGLYPNPLIGYLGEEVTAKYPGRSKHFLFAQQSFVTGGKLGLNREIFVQELAEAQIMRDAQTQRVLYAVRSLYYEALGAQRLVSVRGELAKITREAVEISEELYNIGQADRPDVIAAEAEAQRAELELAAERNREEQVWQMLASVVGSPLPKGTLADNLEGEIVGIDREEMLSKLLQESPRIRVARARLERARAALLRAKAERIPDVAVRVGLGYNFEELDRDEDVGIEGFAELSIALPIFNRNQGNIAAAEAELVRAEKEADRQELSLRSGFALVYSGYIISLGSVERFRKEILPKAKNAYELYLDKFRQVAASYPQVLIAQRTYFQAEVEYVRTLIDLRTSIIQLQSMLLAGGLMLPGEM
ncbi:MAG: TolC family protein [Nitrospirota bacterium]